MSPLTFICGGLVGFSLGLTGGGGAIFAVPLLVYGLGVPAREAVGLSLLTVGATALVGFLERARRQMVEFPTGLLFAAAGMISAPIGTMLANRIPEQLLLGMFATLMAIVAVQLWTKADGPAISPHAVGDDNAGPTCRRDPEGMLHLTSRCALLLFLVGLGAGGLSGLFGVGGGFIIVPALVVFTAMGIQSAIGTSLLVITLISASGTASHFWAGRSFPVTTAGIFTTGSLVGLFIGSGLAHRLGGPTLQRVFAAAIILVALFVMVRTIWH